MLILDMLVKQKENKMNKKSKFDLMDYMSEILQNFYDKNGLEHMCALDSQYCGNYKNQEQYKWLQRFCNTWDKVEYRYSERM